MRISLGRGTCFINEIIVIYFLFLVLFLTYHFYSLSATSAKHRQSIGKIAFYILSEISATYRQFIGNAKKHI